MRILAIDYGKRKIGLAFTESRIAEPLFVLRYKNVEDVVRKLTNLVKQKKVERIVIGVSEGAMAKETKIFAKRIEEAFSLPILFADETLSTHDAQKKAIQAGIKRTKRKKLEDAYAAAIILQAYLDTHTN